MKKKLQIFISSTYTDLIEERQAAVGAILKAGHIPAGMELFTSGDESQMETIERWIDESDIFMLILGGRYGSLEPITSLSYTELEYNYALQSSKPFFAVVIKESALKQKIKEVGVEVTEIESHKELKLFRNKVLSKTSTFYEDSRDIKLAVHETIPDLINRFDFTGWVSGTDIPDVRLLNEQIEKLREENERLSDYDVSVKAKDSDDLIEVVNDSEYEGLIKTLSEITIKVNVKKIIEGNEKGEFNSIKSRLKLDTTTNENSVVEVSILAFLNGYPERLVTGVRNKVGSSAINKLLYFNVFPKLQIYGLSINESLIGVRYRRSMLSPKGVEFLRYLKEQKA